MPCSKWNVANYTGRNVRLSAAIAVFSTSSRPKAARRRAVCRQGDRLGNAPLLIQHGDADQVIPSAFGQQLSAATNALKAFETLPDQGHEALFQPKIWSGEVAFFVQIPQN